MSLTLNLGLMHNLLLELMLDRKIRDPILVWVWLRHRVWRTLYSKGTFYLAGLIALVLHIFLVLLVSQIMILQVVVHYCSNN